MGYRRFNEPSPLRSGLLHAGMSLGVFAGLAGALGVGIHLTADPAAAGPSRTLALFGSPSIAGAPEPALAARYAGLDEALIPEMKGATGPSAGGTSASAGGPGTDDMPVGGQGGPDGPDLVPARMEGRLVLAGTLSEDGVTSLSEADTGTKRDPADLFARPFANPEGRPAVALVIGGLGINATQTRLAIDSLPAEVTLSFAPDARRLDYWIKAARADGHEVLVEIPMEAFEYGRLRMHPDTLIAGARSSGNLARLEQVLGRAGGYFGVINYQGAKFATDDASIRPVFEALSQRGLAFIDDGSIHDAVFADVAGSTGLRYARAAGPIDTRQSPQEIAAELMELEAQALRNGAAMGAGFAFPVTIEAAAIWTQTLEEKGLALVPASAFIASPAAAGKEAQIRTGSLEGPDVNTGG